MANASGADGPVAVAAKKKCKAKCRRVRATNFLKGHSYSYVSYSNTTGASTTARLDLCTNGTYHARGDYVGYSGYAWSDSYDGTWRVASATKTSAQVPYTTSNYQVSDPFYANPPPASGTLAFTAQSATVVYIGSTQFSRGNGIC